MNTIALKFILLIFCVVIVFSCVNNRAEKWNVTNTLVEIDIDSIISNKPIYFSELFSSYHLIQLEASEDCMFSVIDNLKLINDTIYIFDRFITKSVFIFSKTGKFITK